MPPAKSKRVKKGARRLKKQGAQPGQPAAGAAQGAQRRRPKTKTAEELDAEMEDYYREQPGGPPRLKASESAGAR